MNTIDYMISDTINYKFKYENYNKLCIDILEFYKKKI